MAETLSTADGRQLAISPPPDPLGPDPSDQQFAQSMAADGQGPDYPAPRKKRDLEAPHGRGPDGVPLAPYGLNQKTGRPNITKPGPGRGGKKEGAARVQDVPPPAPPAAEGRTDYTADLRDFGEGLWAGLAMLPPVTSKAQATILRANLDGLVEGFNLSAQHNPYIRRGVEYVSGPGGWMLNAAMMVAPFALQSFALWVRPGTLKEQLGASKEELAEIAKTELAQKIEQQKAEMMRQIAKHQAEVAAMQQAAQEAA